MKKTLALILAVLMALSLTAPAFATEETAPPPLAEPGTLEQLVDAALYEGTDILDEAMVWIENHPELVQTFRDRGYVDFAVANHGSSAAIDQLWYWDSLEAAIEELLYSWAWQMLWMQEHLIDATALKAENPELYAQYAANAETYFYEELWYGSVDDFMNYHYGITEEQFVDAMVSYQLQEARWEQEKIDMVATYRTDHPGELEAMDWDAYLLSEYWYYSNIKDFMYSYGLATVEEAYAELEYQYVSNKIWHAQYLIERAIFMEEKRAELGLPAEGYAVMLNGDFLKFSQPLTVKYGNIYAPAEELAKAVGLTGSYADLLVDGQLPVRRTAERAGYSVFWDEILDAAVLIDMGKIATKLDEQVTILNRTMVRANELKSKDGSGALDMALVLLDSLDGDKTYTAAINYTFGWKEQTYWLKGSLTSPNFADIAKMLSDAVLVESWYYTEAELARYEQLFTTIGALKSVDFAMEYNTESGYATFTLPLLTTLGRIMGENMEAVNELFIGKMEESPTLGALLAQATLTATESQYAPYYDYEYTYNDSPVYYWDKMDGGLPAGMDFIADSAFRRVGNEDVMELGLTDLIDILAAEDEYYAEYYAEELKRMLPKFSLVLAVNDKGESRMSFEMRADLGALFGMYSSIGTAAEMTAESKDAGNTQESEMDIHVRNTFTFELKSKVVYK